MGLRLNSDASNIYLIKASYLEVIENFYKSTKQPNFRKSQKKTPAFQIKEYQNGQQASVFLGLPVLAPKHQFLNVCEFGELLNNIII